MNPVGLTQKLDRLLLENDINSDGLLNSLNRKFISISQKIDTSKSSKLHLREVLRTNPRNLDALIILAQILRQEAEQNSNTTLCEEAVELAKRALQENPSTGFVYAECMRSLFSLIPRIMHYEIKIELITELEAALALAPENVEILVLLGTALRDRDQNRSYELFTKAIQIDGNNTLALTCLGELLFVRFGNLGQAREHLEKAYTIDPNHPLTCLFLGEVLHHAKEEARSCALINKAFEDRPKLNLHLQALLSIDRSHLIALMYMSRMAQQGIGGIYKDEREAIDLRRIAKHHDPKNTLNLLRIFSDFDIDARVAQADYFIEYQRQHPHEPSI